MSDIKLNLINLSADANNSDYVIFQQNAATNANTQNVAWIVVKNLGNNDNHPFTYPMNFKVGAKDSNGNYMKQIDAVNDNIYEVVMDNSGHVLKHAAELSGNPNEVEVWNKLETGAIDTQIYRDGKLLAAKVNVPPGSKSNFEFKPSIYIGAVSQIEQGSIMDSNVIVQYLTELPLLGVSAADIIIAGGGLGESAIPYTFTLKNVT